MNIKHQTQPESDTCVSTCIAMILEEPAEVIITEFHDDYFAGKIEIDECLHKRGIRCKSMIAHDQSLLNNKIYFLTIPSLNHKGLFHQILMEVYEDGGYEIHDPAKGREGSLYYVNHDEEVLRPQQMRLKSWIAIFEVDMGDRL